MPNLLDAANKWAEAEASRSGKRCWFMTFTGNVVRRDRYDPTDADRVEFGTSSDPDIWDGGTISIPISTLQQ